MWPFYSLQGERRKTWIGRPWSWNMAASINLGPTECGSGQSTCLLIQPEVPGFRRSPVSGAGGWTVKFSKTQGQAHLTWIAIPLIPTQTTTECTLKTKLRNFPSGLWIWTSLSNAGTWVWPLVRELRPHILEGNKEKPLGHNRSQHSIKKNFFF